MYLFRVHKELDKGGSASFPTMLHEIFFVIQTQDITSDDFFLVMKVEIGDLNPREVMFGKIMLN